MKKTIYFAGKHIVKDKIKSFSVEIHPDYGFMVVIQFINESTEEEYFKDEEFHKLRENFLQKSLRDYEKDPADFAWRQFNIPESKLKEVDSAIRGAIKAIEEEYNFVEEELSKKAEKRMLDIMSEYEAD